MPTVDSITDRLARIKQINHAREVFKDSAKKVSNFMSFLDFNFVRRGWSYSFR